MTTGSRARARSHDVFALRTLAAACMLALAGAAAFAPLSSAAPTTAAPSPSNSELLSEAARAVARKLVSQVPVTPGARIALQAEADRAVDRDMQEALLLAFNERRIPCVLLKPLVVEEPAPDASEADSTAPRKKGDPKPESDASPGAASPALGMDFAKLQAERAAQYARGDSIAKAAGATGSSTPSGASVLGGGAGGNLPVITFRVPEARVDYVRGFRAGIFGAQRVERRATARLSMLLTAPGATAVSWSAAADTSLGDVVLRTELATLEDRTRPETRPTAPTGGAKKIVEPILVVLLVAGLVSLFYQNRP